MSEVTLSIPNISCNHCVMRVQNGTKDLPGVVAVAARAEDKSATFTLESMEALAAVKDALAEIGYPAE
ncbi:MAG TPA: heavy-metal-associated domain-containing protein [Anaerolineae bacterium]|jgi:copper chaperone|nr:heavy-metal-associated domain-containing protein [Anaerolineae bacterium]